MAEKKPADSDTSSQQGQEKRKGGPHRFQKGESGNPGGMKKGTVAMKTKIQEAFVQLLESPVKEKGAKTERPFLESFLEKFRQSALDPRSKAFLIISSRLFGENILDEIDAQLNKSKREDLDFLSYRFFKLMNDPQREVFLSKMRLKLLMWGRRTGKTTLYHLEDAHDATIHPDYRIIYFGLTFERAKDLYWRPLVQVRKEQGTPIRKADETNGEVHLHNGSSIYIAGTSTTKDRNKWRGQKWHRARFDEVQDMPGLDELFLEIVGPSMLDYNGTMTFSGTGPKVRGTFWEMLWTDEKKFKAFRSNKNISDNPAIPNHETVLEKVREDHGWTEHDPVYLREYLGQIVYDDDALVCRLTDENYFEDAELLDWIATQSPEDLRFTAGLDYGFTDSDALGAILYSEKSNLKWLVWEYKKNNTDVTALIEAVQAMKDYLKASPLFAASYHRDTPIFADTSDQKISTELNVRYQISVQNAIKVDADFGIQMLQEEVRKRNFKVRRGGVFDDEALRTIFERTEQGILTRKIDDKAFHPDMLKAVVYGLRNYWLTHKPDHYEAPPTGPVDPNQGYWEQQAALQKQQNQLF